MSTQDRPTEPDDERPCPPPDRLLAFRRGELRGDDSTFVAEHVGTCPACRAAAGQAPPTVAPTTPNAPLDPDLAPVDVPGCRLSGEACGGGMGVVLFGHDRLERPIAVKVLRHCFADSRGLVARFEAEASINARLQHPGIVPVYEVGRLSDGRPYYTMKRVRGETLAVLLASRSSPRQDPGLFLVRFQKVCEAAAYAHGRGVIHRDMKPLNVMVGAHGEVLLVDWGLARLLGEAAPESGESALAPAAAVHATQGVLGTVAYMPPEQARGRETDRRSDVFGLGAILCEVLTGDPPYVGPPEMLLRMAQRADLDGAHERLAACGADAELIDLARRCLAPAPEGRPEDGAALAREVVEYQARVQERLRRAELERRAAEVREEERIERRRVARRFAAVIALLLAGLAAGGWWVARERHQQAEGRARAERQLGEQFEEFYGALRQGRSEAAAREWELIDRQVAELPAPALAGRLKDARRDLDLVADLGALFQRRWLVLQRTVFEFVEFGRPAGRPGRSQAVGQGAGQLVARDTVIGSDDSRLRDDYPAAFARHGFDPAGGEDAFVRRVDASPVKAALIDGLGQWFLADPGNRLVRGVLRRLDEGREPVRRLLAEGGQGQDLAKVEGGESDPVALVIVSEVLPPDLAIRLLMDGAVRWPDSRQLLAVLVYRLLAEKPARAGEAVSYARASYALRPDDHHAALTLAVALRLDGRLEEAVQLTLRVIELAPSSGYARYLLGLAYKEQGRTKEAVEQYVLARQKGMGNAGGYVALGSAFQAVERAEDAIACYKEAIGLDRNHADAHVNLGMALNALGRHGEAVGHLERAVGLNLEDHEAHCQLGWAYIESGHPLKAIRVLQRAIELDPECADAVNRLGFAYSRLERYQDAERELLRALQLNETHDWAMYNLGYAYVELKAYERAIAVLTRGVQLHPANTYLWWRLGMAYRVAGRNPEALRACLRAVELDPSNTSALYDLGVVYNELGQFDRSVALFRRVIGSGSSDGYDFNELGRSYMGLGRHEEALRVLTRATELDPSYHHAWRNLGLTYNHFGQFARSRRMLAVAWRLRPDDVEVAGSFAWTYESEQRFAEAVRVYAWCLDRAPNDLSILKGLSDAYLGMGDHERAMTPARRAVALHPKAWEAHHALGMVLFAREDYEEAIGSFSRAAEIEPSEPTSLYNIGLSHQRLNRPRQAIGWHLEAIALKPDYPEAWYQLAIAYVDLGRYAEATRAAQRAVELSPHDSDTWVGLGVAFGGQGLRLRAIRALEKAVRLNPQSAFAYQNLGKQYWEEVRLDEAVRAVSRAIELAPGDLYSHELLGSIHSAAGAHVRAAATFRAALRLAPADAFCHAGLIGALADAGHVQEAIKATGRARKTVGAEGWSTVRWNAARAAALGGTGSGDAATLAAGRRAELRKQALSWLREELAQCARALPAKPGVLGFLRDRVGDAVGGEKLSPREAADRLRIAIDEPALKDVREPKVLALLPTDERNRWVVFWSDAHRLLTELEGADDERLPAP